MIEHIEVRNFQSLHSVELELAPLTVIVGPSSSGKSALTRALRTLTSNRRGTEFITTGERLTTITAKTDRGTVTLKRGKGTTDNEYIVIPEDDPTRQRTFSKLGGETPPEVSEFIGIDAKDPINYAGQFDAPYLLDDTASEVARTLGSLTNVNVIFEGARESNRRKQNAASTLKTRTSDLETIRTKAEGYKSLKTQRQAIEDAETAIEAATRIQRDIARLTEYLEQDEIATRSIEALKARVTTPPPSAEQALSAHQRLTALTTAISEYASLAKVAKSRTEAHSEAEGELGDLRAEYDTLMDDLTTTLTEYLEANATLEPGDHDLYYIEITDAARLTARFITENLK